MSTEVRKEPSDDEEIVNKSLEVVAFLMAMEEAGMYDLSSVLPAAKDVSLWLNDHIPSKPEAVAHVPPVVIQCTHILTRRSPHLGVPYTGGRCPSEVTIEAEVIEHEARYPLGPLKGWEFTLETGWRCPEHIPVRGGTNPPEGVKGEPDPPSDVRTF